MQKEKYDQIERENKIIALLKYIKKTKKITNDEAVQLICDYLASRAKEFTFNEGGWIDAKHFKIESLLTKPKFNRWLQGLKDAEQEKKQEKKQKETSVKNGFFY